MSDDPYADEGYRIRRDQADFTASFEIPREQMQGISDLIDAAVKQRSEQQNAALEALAPIADRRGIGLAVIVDDEGRWRVELDPEMPPRTIAHRRVNVLLPLAGEERSHHAD